MDEHMFGNRDRTRKINRIENGAVQLYELYDDRKLTTAKEGLRRIGQRILGNRKPDNDSD